MQIWIMFSACLLLVLFGCNHTKNTAYPSPMYDHIVEKYWRLTEINGTQVTEAMWNREPYITLHVEDKRVSGRGGCNSLFGNYTLKGGDKISFSKIGATKMGCPNMTIESQLFKALDDADNLVLANDTLTMKNASMVSLARFVEAVVK